MRRHADTSSADGLHSPIQTFGSVLKARATFGLPMDTLCQSIELLGTPDHSLGIIHSLLDLLIKLALHKTLECLLATTEECLGKVFSIPLA